MVSSHDLIEAMANMMTERHAVNLNPDILRYLIRCGVITDDSSARSVVERLDSARSTTAAIRLSDAAKKYQFSRSLLYRWRDDGWITVENYEPVIEVREADVALAAVLADLIGRKTGRSIFPPKPKSGRPPSGRPPRKTAA